MHWLLKTWTWFFAWPYLQVFQRVCVVFIITVVQVVDDVVIVWRPKSVALKFVWESNKGIELLSMISRNRFWSSIYRYRWWWRCWYKKQNNCTDYCYKECCEKKRKKKSVCLKLNSLLWKEEGKKERTIESQKSVKLCQNKNLIQEFQYSKSALVAFTFKIYISVEFSPRGKLMSKIKSTLRERSSANVAKPPLFFPLLVSFQSERRSTKEIYPRFTRLSRLEGARWTRSEQRGWGKGEGEERIGTCQKRGCV